MSTPLETSLPGTAAADPDSELRDSQRMLASLFENLPGIAYRMLVDEQWTVELMSGGCFELTGYTPDEIIGNRTISYEEITHPLDRARVREAIVAAIAERRAYDLTYRIVAAGGETRWVLERGKAVYDERGQARFIEGFLTDVTERHLAEEQVKEQAALLNLAHDAILVIDMDVRVLFRNQSANELFGWESDQALSEAIAPHFDPQIDVFAQAFATTLTEGEWSGELTVLGRDAKVLTLESHWTLMCDEQDRPKSILLINTDSTERKILESQFLRSQRMESIGTLAGGIAHDLNNVLSPILTSLELLRNSVQQPADLELVDILEASAIRGAEMVKQILTFARGVEGKRVRLDAREIIREVEKIAAETFPRLLTIRAAVARDLWPIVGDATQLHQVLLNLCVNARDAMPGRGLLTLRGGNLRLDRTRALRHPGLKPGCYVTIDVSDTGTGIPEAIQEKIFDPFFTTKEVGKGTGLGLSTAQAIIKSHGGMLTLSSERGKGTTFHIFLPAAVDGPETANPTTPAGPSRGHGECILVVDDEELIRLITKRTLESYGYRVVTASDGAEGLAAFSQRPSEIAAVITDLTMPVMDGWTMITALRQLSAEVPIITASGMAVQENRARARKAGAQAFLAKPYTTEMLLETLREVLAGEVRSAG